MKLVALVALCLGLAGCSGGGATQPTVDPRAVARGTVETLESAWMVTAKSCMAVAGATDNQTTADDCKTYLVPARDAIVAAANAVDAWTAADQGNFPCLIKSAVDGLQNAKAIATLAGPLPQLVNDGFALANMYTPQCVAQDAGKAGQ